MQLACTRASHKTLSTRAGAKADSPVGGSEQASTHRRKHLHLDPVDHAVPDDIDRGYLDTAFAGSRENLEHGF